MELTTTELNFRGCGVAVFSKATPNAGVPYLKESML
jgi:hypothetical protein